MGQVIDLAERREAAQRKTRRREPVRAQFFFDLACPFTYLAAERVERAFSHVTWTPTSSETLQRRCLGSTIPRVRSACAQAAERRAAALRLPLVWPDGFPRPVTAAMRAAAYAAEQGRGRDFVLAAGRLAFCGGFDLDDPEILAEAAAAAGIPLEDCFHAAGDQRRDGAAEAVGPQAAGGRAPTGCRCCGWGARCSGASSASAPPRRRCGRRPRRSRAGGSEPRLRADEPGEDLRVHRVDRVGALGVVLDRRERCPRVVGLVEQQVEIRVRSVAPGDRGDLAFVHVQDARSRPADPHGLCGVEPPDRGVDCGR